MDCLMSFPDFLYAFQTQLFYEGKIVRAIDTKVNQKFPKTIPQYYF